MNCEQIKQKVGIRTVLESFGLFPVKENKRTAFYFALDREEKTASLSVDFIKNTAFDFGTGKNYDIISIVQAKNRCSVAEALEYLQKFDFSTNIQDVIKDEESSSYNILKIIDIQHPALLQYLESRKVLRGKSFIKEVHYKMQGKKYFAIAFFNNSGGMEIRNKYSKMCLGPKDVTHIKSGEMASNEVTVFEGFFDFLSYKSIENDILLSDTDYLVLNSTSMFFAAEDILKRYEKISLFLDNNAAGRAAVAKISEINENVEDCSLLYSDYEDLNQWLTR
ncbi:toprim domain-containing protein [Chryseobacterium sp. B21-037]|uniref:toprim domain-containing protein n=1 Tax=Chryseobacterium sp. B21-037 TaxID=2926038 RepID=UPI002358A823|nr:toprim domain-containing protein [Chryseobacterium sp. B21-037]MDC8105029.1 toprim domain-containing protein [Chryseobacterium sp. B21-037]